MLVFYENLAPSSNSIVEELLVANRIPNNFCHRHPAFSCQFSERVYYGAREVHAQLHNMMLCPVCHDDLPFSNQLMSEVDGKITGLGWIVNVSQRLPPRY